MKVLLLNDTENFYHFGCKGTSNAIKSFISKDHELQSVAITDLNVVMSFCGIGDFDSLTQLEKFKTNNPNIKEWVENNDIIVVNGEGSLHGTYHSTLKLLYLSYISKVFFNKQVCIINHSCYPSHTCKETSLLANSIYKKVYNVLDFVGVREEYSYKLLQELNIKCQLTFDCLPLYIRDSFPYLASKFIAPFNNYYSRKLDKPYICLAGSVVFNSGYKEDYLSLITQVYKKYIKQLSKLGFAVYILSSNMKVLPALEEEKLFDLLSTYKLENIKLIRADNIDQWLECIGRAKLLLSGRFHHSIAAVCLNTPFIAFESNTPKINAISSALGIDQPIKYDDNNLYRLLMSKTSILLRDGAKYDLEFLNKMLDLAENNFNFLTDNTIT